jgi:hypothetical protein
MRIVEASSSNGGSRVDRGFLDMATIRRRVARIKNGWNEETARARATEGARRRRELEELLIGHLCDVGDSEESCDLRKSGFSLVG